MDNRTLAEITACFNAFPQSRDTDKDLLIRTVVRDVSGIEDEAIVRVCQAFTAGEVKGQSLDFAPSVPRFVKACRDQQAALEYARRPKIEHKPDEPQHSDEHRAMMLKRLSQLSSTLGTKSDVA